MNLSHHLLLSLVIAGPVAARAGELTEGQGLTEEKKERLVLDDMQDVSDWYNGSPDESVISASDQHVKFGTSALRFANRVDHTKGEKNYPVGWPRTGKDLAPDSPTDWSPYDFFECWVYAQTSRPSLPKTPIGVGFYHSGQKRSSHFPLGDVKKDTWVRIIIPIDKLLDPKDVRRVQFNISESDYQHGDQVDFTIDGVALTRFLNPAISQVTLNRRLLYSHDHRLAAHFKLVGHRNLETTKVALEIGKEGEATVSRTSAPATREGELVLHMEQPLAAGSWEAVLLLRDGKGVEVDRKQVPFRVIAGPFEEK